jgi:gas vesicle protein
VLIGAAIGAAVGMVYAPKAGEETREEVTEGVRKFKDMASERGRRLLHRRHHEGEEIAEQLS